jgi:phage tail-like protein
MQRAAIERLLPSVFQRALLQQSPLMAVLDVMEDMHAPCERAIAAVADVFNARHTEERYLTMLAHWVNLDRIYPTPGEGSNSLDWHPQVAPIAPGRLRELICNAAFLAQWRGTARGLQRFLEIATGVSPYVLQENVRAEDGTVVPYHVRLIAPLAAQVHQELIERIVEQEKPAYVTWELSWA